MTGKSLFPPVRRIGPGIWIVLLFTLCALCGRPAPAGAAPAPAARPDTAVPSFKAIAAGGGTCAITASGGVLCWGHGRPFPLPVSGLESRVQAVAVGSSHACALTEAGAVKCWGRNSGGQLGDGTTIDRSTPVDAVGLTSGVQAVTAGYEHTCALTSGGGVKCWGQNDTGQLGDGTTVDHTTPVDVAGLAGGVQAVTAGGTLMQLSFKPPVIKSYGHTCALTTSGAVLCWGANDSGQLGNALTPEVHTPIAVPDLVTGVQAIAAGFGHTCALTVDGGAKCWGANWSDQLGSGAGLARPALAYVIGLERGVQAIAAGGDHSCALMAGGGVKCWGRYPGDGSARTLSSPVQVSGVTSDTQAIAVGADHACALAETGAVKCWGSNQSGQLGNYMTTGGWLMPTKVVYLDADVHVVAAGGDHTCALAAGAPAAGWRAACWGYNPGGQLGDGGDVDRMLPRTVTGLDTGIQALAAGGGHTCALDTGGEVSCWGENFYGQLGDGTTEFKRLTPVAVSGLSGGVSAISAGSVHTCALLSGTVKCWGMNGGGQVGDGSTENRYAPVDVAVGADVQAIATGDSHTCALLTNGQIKCWGAYKTNTPASASLGGHLATAVAAGGGHTCALTTGGGVKCWGANYFGQLGDGTQTDRTEPVDVVGLSSGVQAIAAHGGRSCAILAAGKLLCWGNNYQGILGDGTMADRLTPAPVLGLAGPVQAVTLGFWHACALVQAPDAAQPIVQCWGSNSYGQLGVNPGWLPVDVIIPDVLGYLPYAGTD